MGGSCNGPLLWHLKSFRTCNDFVEIAVKRFFDNDKIRIALPAAEVLRSEVEVRTRLDAGERAPACVLARRYQRLRTD